MKLIILLMSVLALSSCKIEHKEDTEKANTHLHTGTNDKVRHLTIEVLRLGKEIKAIKEAMSMPKEYRADDALPGYPE